MKEIKIDGEVYVPKSGAKSQMFELAKPKGKIPYVLVRTYSAGVFTGYLKARTNSEVDLVNARRLWYWDGAASLSQLAMEGVSKPENCKFPCEVSEIKLLNVIEIIQVSEKAKKSISEVKVWTQ